MTIIGASAKLNGETELLIGGHNVLGGVDGFDEDEAESKGHNGAVVLGRLLTAQRHALEALQLIRTEEEPKAVQSRRLDIDVATDAS